MKETTVKWIADQIERYRTAKGAEREILRNRIYNLLRKHLVSTIRNYLRDRGYKEDTEQTILSMSWDCFVKGLQQYSSKDRSQLLRHFQMHCVRHVKNMHRGAKWKEVELKAEEVDRFYSSCPDSTVDGLMLLRSFRDQLPHEYRAVLDDTIRREQRVFDGVVKFPMPEYRYREAKRCFQMVIEFLVKGS